jgi:hypothetical protein
MQKMKILFIIHNKTVKFFIHLIRNYYGRIFPALLWAILWSLWEVKSYFSQVNIFVGIFPKNFLKFKIDGKTFPDIH